MQRCNKVVKGIIRAVNTSTNILTIENEDNDKYESYTIASGARVYRGDKLSDIYQLRMETWQLSPYPAAE